MGFICNPRDSYVYHILGAVASGIEHAQKRLDFFLNVYAYKVALPREMLGKCTDLTAALKEIGQPTTLYEMFVTCRTLSDVVISKDSAQLKSVMDNIFVKALVNQPDCQKICAAITEKRAPILMQANQFISPDHRSVILGTLSAGLFLYVFKELRLRRHLDMNLLFVSVIASYTAAIFSDF